MILLYERSYNAKANIPCRQSTRAFVKKPAIEAAARVILKQ